MQKYCSCSGLKTIHFDQNTGQAYGKILSRGAKNLNSQSYINKGQRMHKHELPVQPNIPVTFTTGMVIWYNHEFMTT